jgi:hypothetical protein
MSTKDHVANTVGELLDLAAALERATYGTRWYRGHGSPGWKLLPGAFRPDLTRGREHYERIVSQLFQLRARARHERCPARADFAAWMFVMQHYRLPTRLLDWTESPLIGAYFALWNDAAPLQQATESAVIYALAPNELNRAELGHDLIALLEDDEVRPLIPAWLDPRPPPARPEGREGRPDPHAAAILPEQVDPRIVAQQAAFTIHAPEVDLESIPGHQAFLDRIVIPRERREPMRQDLLRLGIRPMNLFPDLEHHSLDLKNFEQVL